MDWETKINKTDVLTVAEDEACKATQSNPHQA